MKTMTTMMIATGTIAFAGCASTEREPLDATSAARLYVDAVEAGDARAVERVLSTEMLGRIHERGAAGSDEANLELFVDKEQAKLVANLADTAAIEIDVQSFEPGVAVASLQVAGEPVAKPLYLVQQADGWHVNVVPPAKSTLAYASTSAYQVKNDDLVNRSFSCSGTSTRTVSALGQYQVSCGNTCSGWFDGTRFTVNGGSVTCDYNTWGVDMYIRSNRAVCYDRC